MCMRVKDFNEELSQRLETLREQHLYRQLLQIDSAQSPNIQIDGKSYLNFSSNDYLGLANDPAVTKAAVEAIEKFGAGSGASRLISGSLAPHIILEQKLAAFKKTEAALTFSSGYAAAVGTICALLDHNDVIAVDKLVHASIVDAARLSGAKLRVFGHNDFDGLAKILAWADRRHKEPALVDADRQPRTLIVTESIYSMDGDRTPLRELVTLKETFGAWLMIDEAHGTGVYGATGRGLAEEYAVADKIEIQMGTLGKALGSAGGYICGSKVLIDYLINRARSFIFSTAPVPAASAAASAAIDILQSDRGIQLRKALWQRIDQFCDANKNGKSKFTPIARGSIVPVIIGNEAKAMEVAHRLRSQGIFVPAVRFPTVARGQARLRITLSAAHSVDDVNKLIDAIDASLSL
jgi:8-amino-7-oxononanoate synthase